MLVVVQQAMIEIVRIDVHADDIVAANPGEECRVRCALIGEVQCARRKCHHVN